jgi:hypothetical protein
VAVDTAAKRLSAANGVLPWDFGPPFPDGTIDQADRQTIAFVYGGVLAGGAPDVIDEPDFLSAIRAAIIASSCSMPLATYKGSKAVFTATPVPYDAPYPMVVITFAEQDHQADAIRDYRPVLTYRIEVAGEHSAPPDQYRIVSEVAYCLRTLFHRKRNLSAAGWGLTQQACTGPIDEPSAEQTTSRVLTLNVSTARLYDA